MTELQARQPLLTAGQNPIGGTPQAPPSNGSVHGFRLLRCWEYCLPKRQTSMGSQSVRIEPKTFFANERTLLSWMNIAVMLATLSLTLLNFGVDASRIAGLILSPVAIFFIIYSFVVYMRRNNALIKKEPIQYNDMLGPAILVVTLVVSLSTIIILNIMYGGKLSVKAARPILPSSSNAHTAAGVATEIAAAVGSNLAARIFN
eukprot:GDKI01008444.1.p1 GENE.GDKI01008444.1~~GDKI01008444.1.p1  ORF type:complete len:203 (-),score=69.39 GDKI01008444.1:271-879(-)